MSDTCLTIADLRLDHFTALIGESFTVRYPDVTETLRLTKAEGTRSDDDPRRQRQPFSLIFEGSTPNLMLNQMMHPIDHQELGCHDIFIVPIGRTPDGTTRYQASFN
jgi:hypothetical protein